MINFVVKTTWNDEVNVIHFRNYKYREYWEKLNLSRLYDTNTMITEEM